MQYGGFISDDTVKMMVFFGNLNRPIPDKPDDVFCVKVNYKHVSEYDPGTDMYTKIREKKDGKWIYENRNLTLYKGDVIHYKLILTCIDGSYRVKLYQYFTVRKINGVLVPEIPYAVKADKYYADDLVLGLKKH